MQEDTEVRWIHPETRKRAALNAKYAANTAKWNLNSAIFLFGIIILVIILAMLRVNVWLNGIVAFTGLFLVWVTGQRKAKKLFRHYFEWELARHQDDWKDYYRSLGIGPSAGSEEIDKVYRRLSDIYSEVLSDGARLTPLYSMMFREAKEAYSVLSDPEVKAEYDRVFWLKYNGTMTDIEVPARSAIVDLSHSISGEISEYLKKFGCNFPSSTKTQRRVCVAVVTVLLVIGITGTSFAFARPDSALAAPFKGAAMTIARVTSGAISLIDDVRSIGASSERQVVSTSLQLMRISEDVRILVPVTEPTNDMAYFPSREHSLFPTYLDRRYSQFSYTVDEYGIITVHTESSTVDPVLDKIESLILNLE
jgi:Ca2+/Na+ antiporter